jgi:hypothetical protein
MGKYLLITLFAFGINANAQPVLTAGNANPVIGDAFHWVLANNQASPGATGANQTWNFSSLVTSNVWRDTVVYPASAIHGSDFPTSDVSIFIQNAYYTFFQTEIDSFVFKGAGSYSWEKINSNPEIYLTYPFTYNSTFTDSYAASENNGGTIISITGTVTVTGDGYGTLQLPYETFTDVLRIKMIENEVQTISGNPTNVTRTKYLWYMSGMHQPILAMTYLSAYGTYSTQYLSGITVGINEYENLNDIAIFPNPANDNITIENNSQINNGSISIYNIQGQMLIQQPLQLNKTEINISNFAKGIYILKFECNDGFAVKKFVKK